MRVLSCVRTNVVMFVMAKSRTERNRYLTIRWNSAIGGGDLRNVASLGEDEKKCGTNGAGKWEVIQCENAVSVGEQGGKRSAE